MKSSSITYNSSETIHVGQLVYDETIQTKQPAVLVVHAWQGLDSFAIEKAHELAEMGYVAFAVDLYGEGKQAENNVEAAKLMRPLFLDRVRLRERIVAAYNVVAKHEKVDVEKIGAIGFCFGGLTIIELLRSGAKLRGLVSFHAILGQQLDGVFIKKVPSARKMHGSVLILHGYNDPLVTSEDISSLQEELSLANVDWQMHTYGHTFHAFSNPEASDAVSGMLYSPKSTERAWLSMSNFFEEVFS